MDGEPVRYEAVAAIEAKAVSNSRRLISKAPDCVSMRNRSVGASRSTTARYTVKLAVSYAITMPRAASSGAGRRSFLGKLARGSSSVDGRRSRNASADLERSSWPFAERFRWPQVAPWAIDPHVGIARFDAYLDLARLFAALPGLGGESVEVAFIDIAGLGAWNNAYGMDAGDSLLRWVADQLRTVQLARPYRDGGDEFLLVRAPGRGALGADVAALFEAWPSAWAKIFGGAPVVPPRGVVAACAGRDLVDARNRLSRALGDLKQRVPRPAPTGTLAVLR